MNNKEDESQNDNDNSHQYIVQNGDTLQSIAVRFDVTVSWILQINHMLSDFILPGDVIKVWKRDIDDGYMKDIPARLVDPNNIEGHSPHGHLFLYPDRIVFNAEVRDESLTILFDGIKDIDIIIHPFNEITTIPPTPVSSKHMQNTGDSSSLPSSYPPTPLQVNVQSPLSLKEIKPEELLYLMMINYDESKVIQSGTEVHVTDLNNNADESSENSKFNCVFFSSMRKHIEPFKHELVTAVNKRRIETMKKKKEGPKGNSSDVNNNNSENSETQNLNSNILQDNNDQNLNTTEGGDVILLEDADTWVPEYYKAPNNKGKKRKDKDKDNDNENDRKRRSKRKRNSKTDNDPINGTEQTVSTPTFDPNFKKRYSNPKPLFPINLINGPSEIVTIDDITQIRRSLPYRFRNSSWHLIYRLSNDGSSYYTFYRKTEKKIPLVLLILTDKDEKIGSYLSKGIHISSRYYGSGESFVFHFSPRFESFKWSQENDYFISSPEDQILIGGGGASAIWIDSGMSSAFSGECATFASPSLTSEPNFKILNIEVWSLDTVGSLSTNAITRPPAKSTMSSSSFLQSSDSSQTSSQSKITCATSSPNLE